MQHQQPLNIPIYLSAWIYLFLIGWTIRVFVLPYKVAQRVERPFRYGDISSEELSTLTASERNLRLSHRLFAMAGILDFIFCAVWFFRHFGPWGRS